MNNPYLPFRRTYYNAPPAGFPLEISNEKWRMLIQDFEDLEVKRWKKLMDLELLHFKKDEPVLDFHGKPLRGWQYEILLETEDFKWTPFLLAVPKLKSASAYSTVSKYTEMLEDTVVVDPFDAAMPSFEKEWPVRRYINHPRGQTRKHNLRWNNQSWLELVTLKIQEKPFFFQVLIARSDIQRGEELFFPYCAGDGKPKCFKHENRDNQEARSRGKKIFLAVQHALVQIHKTINCVFAWVPVSFTSEFPSIREIYSKTWKQNIYDIHSFKNKNDFEFGIDSFENITRTSYARRSSFRIIIRVDIWKDLDWATLGELAYDRCDIYWTEESW